MLRQDRELLQAVRNVRVAIQNIKDNRNPQFTEHLFKVMIKSQADLDEKVREAINTPIEGIEVKR